MRLKNSGQAPFTENHLKGLKNTSKGSELESCLSFKLHRLGIPVLVSPKLLRSFGLGQLDIVLYYQNSVEIFEVKTHPELLSKQQYYRLLKSQAFMMDIFNARSKMQVINSLPKELSFLNLSI